MDSFEPVPLSEGAKHRAPSQQSRIRVLLSGKAAAVVVAASLFFSVIGVLRIVFPFHSQPKQTEIAAREEALQAVQSGGAGEQEKEQAEAVHWVYVTGAVGSPRVVAVPADSRLDAVIQAAGGLTSSADPTSVNLAREVEDGEHVHVLAEGEADTAERQTPPDQDGAEEQAQGIGSGCVDLNTATLQDLETLDGVGPKIAARIADYRENSGGFTSNEELLAVSGIGPKLLQRISVGLCPD